MSPRHAAPRQDHSRWRVALLVTAIALTGAGLSAPALAASTLTLQVSTAADRANPVPLTGARLTGKVAIFAVPSDPVSQVAFTLDPGTAGAISHIESLTPYDFAATVAADGTAYLFDTARLAAGSHTMSATATLTSGAKMTATATFSTGTSTVIPTASSGLAFALPERPVLRASARKVFAHFFTPYAISFDNKTPKSLGGTGDYYDTGYLSPTGESGAHSAYGGLLRDRPVPRAPLPTTDWWAGDLATEIAQAKAAGLDGFTVDLLTLYSTTSRNSLQVQRLLTAADRTGDFDVVLMPDMSAWASKTPTEVAASVAKYAAGHPSAYRLSDGRLVVSPFYAEKWSVTAWKSFFTALAGYTDTVTGKPFQVAFVPTFLNFGANYAAFAPISVGFSNWGNRSPAANQNIAKLAATAHATTCTGAVRCLWMSPVSVQDERPNQGIYDEAANTENLRTTWLGAIAGDADWVQLVTWNDYSEGTSFAPSANSGWTWLDINAYFLTRFKTGGYPTITADTLYLTHRIHAYAARPSYPQTKLMALRSGSTPARNTVEVLVFLAAPATVTLRTGAGAASVSAPAGVSAYTVPLAPGTVSATATRSGTSVASIVSTATVTATPYVQDLSYRGFSSRR